MSLSLDREALANVRGRLTPAPPKERMWPAVCAAALLAISALAFATAMIIAPPLTSHHPAHDRGVD